MKKIKVTKELLADATLGRIIHSLNKEARESLVNITDEEWHKELDNIRKELRERSWKDLWKIYGGSLVKDLNVLREDIKNGDNSI